MAAFDILPNQFTPYQSIPDTVSAETFSFTIRRTRADSEGSSSKQTATLSSKMKKMLQSHSQAKKQSPTSSNTSSPFKRTQSFNLSRAQTRTRPPAPSSPCSSPILPQIVQKNNSFRIKQLPSSGSESQLSTSVSSSGTAYTPLTARVSVPSARSPRSPSCSPSIQGQSSNASSSITGSISQPSSPHGKVLKFGGVRPSRNLYCRVVKDEDELLRLRVARLSRQVSFSERLQVITERGDVFERSCPAPAQAAARAILLQDRDRGRNSERTTPAGLAYPDQGRESANLESNYPSQGSPSHRESPTTESSYARFRRRMVVTPIPQHILCE